MVAVTYSFSRIQAKMERFEAYKQLPKGNAHSLRCQSREHSLMQRLDDDNEQTAYNNGIEEVKRRNVFTHNIRREIRAINKVLASVTTDEDEHRSRFLAAHLRTLPKQLFPGLDSHLPKLSVVGSLDIDTQLPVIVDDPIPETPVLLPLLLEQLQPAGSASNTANAQASAEAASRIQELEAQLASKEASAAQQLAELQQQLASKEASAAQQLAELQQQLASKEASAAQLESQSRDTIERLERELRAKETDRAVHTEAIQRLERQVADAEQSRSSQSALVNELSSQIERLQSQAAQQVQAATGQQATLVNELRETIDRLQRQVNEREEQISSLVSERQSGLELTGRIQTLEAQLQAKEARVLHLVSRVDELQKSEEQTQQRLELLNQGLISRDVEISGLKSNLATLRSELLQATNDANTSQQQVVKLRGSIAEYEKKLAEFFASITSMQEELAAKDTEIDALNYQLRENVQLMGQSMRLSGADTSSRT